jgi:hypothetical protein
MTGASPRTAPKQREARCLSHLALTLVCIALSAPLPAVRGGQQAPAGGVPGRSSSAARRPPWTGSKFLGTPEAPPPYTVELAFPHLRFEFPVVKRPARGELRLERDGGPSTRPR